MAIAVTCHAQYTAHFRCDIFKLGDPGDSKYLYTSNYKTKQTARQTNGEKNSTRDVCSKENSESQVIIK